MTVTIDTNRQTSKIGSWSFDFNKKLFFATNDTYLIFGRSQDAFDGSLQNVLEFIVEEDRDAFVKGMEAAYGGTPLNLMFRIYTSDGALKHIHARAEMFYHADESPDVMIGTVQDVTEQFILERDFTELHINSISAEREDHNKFAHLKMETEAKLKEIKRSQMSFMVGSWALDFADMAFNWSDVTYQIYGLDPSKGAPDFETFIGKVHPDDRSIITGLLENIPKESPFEVEFRIIREEGNIRHIKHLVEVIHDDHGQPVTIRGNIQDITDQREMEKKIKTSLDALNALRKRFDLMVDNTKDIFEIVDENGRIKYISPAVEKLIGISKDEIEGRHIFDFVEGDEGVLLSSLFKQCIEQPDVIHTGIIKTIRQDGEIIHLEVSMTNHLRDADVGGIVLNWKDITTKVDLDTKVHQLSNFDELTGLPNRSYFKATLSNRVEAYAEKSGKFAVFMIDIDEFKGINNVLSIEFGDSMIMKVGREIEVAMQNRDIFLARFYGDQFGLIVDRISGVMEGQIIAEQLLDVFSRSFVIEPYELHVTASIGFSVFPDDSMESDALIKFANIALSRAKDLGKLNFQAYSPLMDIKSFKDFSLRNDFKKAIEQGELEVYYQPIVNLKTGDIISAEALTRWHHPEWGMVPPSEFIPIAESTGLIIPMGKWLLGEVCRQYKRWTQQGLKNIKVSVNYSVLQFYEVNFVREILDTIESHHLTPNFLIVEITESVLINQNRQTEKDLADLKNYGIQIAIDDFGTGYSSLTYLSSMSVDILKIDRAFIDDLAKRERSAKILIAIINLAKELGMKLVAEGVSEWSHLNFLRRHDCFAGQGYLFSRPLPSQEFEAVLSKGYIEPAPEQPVYISPEEEQRHSERVVLRRPIEADMTIIEINKQPVKVGRTKAQIKDIGLSGISFTTNVKFPVKNDIILQFNFETGGQHVEVKGTIIWTEELEPGEHLFGFKFISDVQNMDKVKKIVSTLQKNDGKINQPETIYDLILKSGKLPMISEEICEILDLLRRPSEVEVEVLAQKVGASEALNKMVLDNINSGYFRIAKKVFTIEEAIILLGMKTVLNLIVFFVTKLLFDFDLERENRKFDIYQYWRHVLGTSVAAQMISQHLKKGDKHMLFTYGLVHDIGIPVLDNCLPEHLDKIAEKVSTGTHQIVAEKIVLGGLTHSDIGAWLCEQWHFSEEIKEIVTNHHTPLLSNSKSIDTMIIYVADVMSTENQEKLLGMHSNIEVSEKVLGMLGLTKEAYREISARLTREVEKVGTYFLLGD